MTFNRTGVALGAVGVFAAGALTMYLFAGRVPGDAPARLPVTPPDAHAPATATPPVGPLIVQVSPELVARAGIRVESVGAGAADQPLRVPGTVQPNAYSKVSVTPLAGGRVTRVPIALGQHVTRGATLAEIYSPDLAEARTRYVSMKAELEAGEARVARIERLARIGAASQQELEQATAEHTRHQTDVEQAAARLRLLGVDPARVTHSGGGEPFAATIRVEAPQDGVVLERPATVGMTVESSTVLATLVRLSPVWVMANIYERDFGAVRAGASASITTDAYPDVTFPGTLTYVSPEVRQETRTVEARVEVPNVQGRLRLGMFVNVTIDGIRRPSGALIPRTAVQTVGAQSVVYIVVDQAAGRFEERPVLLGERDSNRVAVMSGLVPGDRIVTEGSFSLRAEVERQGLRPAAAVSAETPTKAAAPAQSFTVRVTPAGFEPSTLTLRAGEIARITFTRTTDATCATEVVFPDYAIRRALPLNEPVTVEFTPKRNAAGFLCGMNMLRGTLVVR
jgi:cobalt-zinc-cadmium efflux system membrane fusion protein